MTRVKAFHCSSSQYLGSFFDDKKVLRMEFRKLTQEEIKERLSPAYIEHVRRAFQSFDTEKSGNILVTELPRLFNSISHIITTKKIDEVLVSLYLDENLKINFDEFLDMVANLETARAKAEDDPVGKIC